ncbi:HAD family hydrolase [Promicromonospora sp. NPDC023987]|uniref:HAD family hydrolase n=1 Tax=Promicromonospora sp. NPDC023987 TaxID=3155360 RepID=UPI0033D5B116
MSTTTETRLVALDIDGTIVPSGSVEVPHDTARAVRDVVTAGHHVVLCTGRSLVGAMPITRALGLTTGTVVCSNGAVTVRLDPALPGGYEVTKTFTFAAGSAIALVRKCLLGVQIAVEEVGWGYHVTRLFGAGEVNGAQRIATVDQIARYRTPRMILRAPAILDLAGDLRRLGLTATPADGDWLDVTPGSVSKASALEHVRDTLGVARELTVGVGDGLNDLPMFAWAAYAVAMGQARAVVIEAADHVTGTIDEQGLVPVLRALVPTPVAPHLPSPTTASRVG